MIAAIQKFGVHKIYKKKKKITQETHDTRDF